MTTNNQANSNNTTTLFDKDSSSSSSSFGNENFIYNSNQKLTIQQQRISLPIYQNRKHILYLLEKYSTLVIIGNTGCGKSTQIPQYLFESGWADGFRTVLCTQPRRVAAISLAERVAQELGEQQVGKTVGYSVRFDEKISDIETRIKYMTDGMLIREMMLDPLLLKYSVIMIDEAHERSLQTDILMGLLKKVQKKRNSSGENNNNNNDTLKLIVSSATLNAQDFFNFFNYNQTNDKSKDTSTILSIEGRTYPVDIHYLEEPTSNYIQQTLQTIIDIHLTQPPGDILVFLTGQEEIERMIQTLDDKFELQRQQQQDNKNKQMMKYLLLPMYSGLSINKQIKVFESVGDSKKIRKIIIATNIAETSITIDGVVYVVDCGFVKIKSYDSISGLESLVIVPTSKSSANQRSGRAGRNRAGKCYRLYTESTYDTLLPDQTIPEIQRSNLTTTILQLKALGIDNILNFDFISQPPSGSLIRGLEVLYGLGALDDNGRLTNPTGMIMAEFPTDPTFSKMIVQSSSTGFNCSEECITITAMLNIQGLFTNQNHKSRKHLLVKEGDHITLLNIFNSFISNNPNSSHWCHQHQINYKAMQRVLQVRKQLLAYANKYSIKVISCFDDPNISPKNCSSLVRKAIVSGFFTNAAQLQPDGSYQTIREKHKLWLHPTSVLCLSNSPQWVIFNEVTITTKEYMKDVISIEPNWLYEIAPHYYKFKK
ncbi:hypothetical protein RB653_007276 [Dictyostelium firmibasis]|uniref:RNA helicase n=1 Tax=Dictyostelium firmibasis TaxID=79012 RepID=A0AAN7U0Y0_9MYCE